MYALIQFLVDKVKAIVPVKYIKNFNPEQFENDYSRAYKVFWKSPNGGGTGYLHAVVLLVDETVELVKERRRRIKMPTPKRLDELLASTLDSEFENSGAEDEIRRKNKEVQEKKSICEREKLKGVLEKLREKKRPLLTSSDEGVKTCTFKAQSRDMSLSPFSSSNEDELDPKSELKRVNDEKVLRNLKLKQEENVLLKKKVDQLQDLNISLQQQIITLLSEKNNSEQTSAQKLLEAAGTAIVNVFEKNVLDQLRKNPPNQTLLPDKVKTIENKERNSVIEEGTYKNANNKAIYYEENSDVDQYSSEESYSRRKELHSPASGEESEFETLRQLKKKRCFQENFPSKPKQGTSASPLENRIESPQVMNRKCNCSTELTGLMHKMLSEVESVKKEIQLLRQESLCLSRKISSEVDIVEPEILPVTTVEDLMYLNDTIADNEEFLKLVYFLGRMGGRDVGEITRRILSSIMTNSVALRLNWIGGFGKKAMKDLNRIILLICASVRQCPTTKDTSQVTIEDIVKRWLRTACDRDGGRSNRKVKSIEIAENVYS